MLEVGAARGADERLDPAVNDVLQALADTENAEAGADAFVASRLAGDWGGVFGTLPRTTPFDRILERAIG